MGAGTLVIVVGPSGAGKDSVMSFAEKQLGNDPKYQFVRRVITRASDDDSEIHHSVSLAEFDRQARAGHFAVVWDAHGLRYGIPGTTGDFLANGGIAIANGSRHALAAIAAAFPALKVVLITAQPAVIERRLAKRGRETADAIANRLQRAIPSRGEIIYDATIDNSGALSAAGEEFILYVSSLA